jgi:hypothetical protein
MPRFCDDWVVDKTMFDFAMGGSCGCCGSKDLFNSDLKSLIDQCTDLETDAASAELSAAERSPWPPDMRNEVWAGRVKLRLRMKREKKTYREFFEQNAVTDVEDFMINDLGADILRKIFQLPRSVISDTLKEQYAIPKHSAYGALMITVCEQVAHFDVTKYDPDGHGEEELNFEDLFSFDRRGGFVIKVNEEDLERAAKVFVSRMVTLGGPALLSRRRKGGDTHPDGADNDEGDTGDADDGDEVPANQGPSFRSDRRMMRLLIARHWADQIISKWNTSRVSDTKGEIVDGTEKKEEV